MGIVVFVPLPVDAETSQRLLKETHRLEKRLKKVRKSLGQVTQRLNSPKYRNNAPDYVIEQDTSKKTELEIEEKGVIENLNSLAELASHYQEGACIS